ncbi:hypothetical protein [Sulfuriflexus sp.]|uniref:hypothetical protein n=1 Tax=Sulfuriflexus sp. TaxID=2015443 RepID=UPI0028CCCCE6|nr:hypothetical protein [Sulfuriflexus sp.]MDT8403145.1 hypothetical protein [Sulfuriflexus sp.]
MGRNPPRRDSQTRQRIAQDAARLMVEHGIKDFYSAKQKAAEAIGISDRHVMPRNTEVEEAIFEYQRIFKSRAQPQRLQVLRHTAIKAMGLLQEFHPRLVGSVLRGTAGEHSDVNLHVFADTPEAVSHFLSRHKIPHEQREKRFRVSRDHYEQFTAYSFVAGDVPIDIVVFPVTGQRQAPLSPVDGKPMERVSVSEVEVLLHEMEFLLPEV